MIYLTSDLHIYHNNIIRYCHRPFDDVTQMDQTLIRNWNDTVDPQDTVYLLGDLTLRDPRNLIETLNGHIILIRGNHDRKGPWKRSGLEIHKSLEMTIGPFKALLCHYPILKEESKWDNQLQKDLRPKIDDYDFIVCGHVHQIWKYRETCINIGVDVRDFRPISMVELEAEMVSLKHGSRMPPL